MNHVSKMEIPGAIRSAVESMRRRTVSNSTNQPIPILPQEVLDLVASQVWNYCESISELLNWHSTKYAVLIIIFLLSFTFFALVIDQKI